MKAALRKLAAPLALCLVFAVSARAIEKDAANPGAIPSVNLSGVVKGPVSTEIQTPALSGTDVKSVDVQIPEAVLPEAKAETQQPNIPAAVPGTQLVLQQLSPENSANVSDEQSRDLAAKLIDPNVKVGSGGLETPVAGSLGSSKESLAPWQQQNLATGVKVPEGKASHREPRPTLRERLHYGDLWIRNIWFYVYTNIRNKWGPYLGYWRKLRDSGQPNVVSRPRGFFATMRVFGQTGYFYVPGFGPVEDAEVVREARRTFRKFFDGPGITEKEIAAFDGFVERALLFNNKRRAASKFRATVRDNMLKASTMTPEKIAPFFDGLPIAAKTDDFQNNGTAESILAQFQQVALDVIKEEPKDAPDRVTGVILIGSFALGAATPKSDFDVEPLTADGGSGRVRLFASKVEQRWKETGRHVTNPVSFHYFGYLNSRWEIRAIHHEPYLIISPDQSIVDNLAMRPGEGPSHIPTRKLTAAGRVLRALQYGAVYATSLITPANVK